MHTYINFFKGHNNLMFIHNLFGLVRADTQLALLEHLSYSTSYLQQQICFQLNLTAPDFFYFYNINS